ncbi:MAG: Hsp70 family protein [Streptococcus salivarius]
MRKKAIGIDLGTTNSVMAVVREDVPEIIPMGTNDDQVLRSAVYFSNIGGKTMCLLVRKPLSVGTEIGSTENFKFDFKRDIGRPIASDTPDTHVSILLFFQPWF